MRRFFLAVLGCILSIGWIVASGRSIHYDSLFASASSLVTNAHAYVAPHCESSATVKILMYHYVRAAEEDAPRSVVYQVSIDPDAFRSQMESLARLRDTGELAIAHMSDLETFETTKCYPNKHIVIPTADDGWEDAYTDIFPVAKYFGIKFTLAIISGKVATGSGHTAGFVDEREIREMLASKVIEIQSHSVTHQDFSVLTASGTRHEICDSKRDLEQRFGVHINTFVFPAGHMNAWDAKILKKCGYVYALTTKRGNISSDNVSVRPFALPRIRLARGFNFARSLRFE